MDLPTLPDKGEATYRLFRKLYRVKAPRALTLSETEIELYGQRVTGIKHLDKYLANEWVNGRVTVITMAKIVDEGGGIQFMNKEDTKAIYSDITQHFVNWEHILDYDLNATPPPIEEIECLKSFRDSLEVFAGYFDRRDPEKNQISEFSVLSGRTLRRKFKPQRISIGGLSNTNTNRDVVVEHIRSYDDLQQIDRSR